MEKSTRRTVEVELRKLFPHGTKPGGRVIYGVPPLRSTDVFAAAAHLLEASGAYQYIAAPFEGTPVATSRFGYRPPSKGPTTAELERWIAIGRSWVKTRPEEVDAIWKLLWSRRKDDFVATPLEKAPVWWKHAHALLVISDEASADLGYSNDGKSLSSLSNGVVWADLQSSLIEKEIPSAEHPGDVRHVSRHIARDSVSRVDREVIRVLPKGRTTELGCSFRTFSHNLAVLPPHGNANTYWHVREEISDNSGELNILVVPYPYLIPDGSFVGMESTKGSGGDRRWGRFKVVQKWLNPKANEDTQANGLSTVVARRSITAFIRALLNEARKKGVAVNGVVLPEYALDWNTYDMIARELRDCHSEVEFLVSGVSVDCNGNVGNKVTYTVFNTGTSAGRVARTYSRGKHHRWLLDASQINQYDLAGDLDPSVDWWEYLEVAQRAQHIDVFRNSSTLTAVICEDLARVDPGLVHLRNIGPSIVFALLMDGPQLPFRWPGVYATNLADDPGSSVLTVSSLGLVKRSNAVRARKAETQSRSVALWRHRPPKNSTGPVADSCHTLELGPSDHAVLLRLRSEPAQEVTMDGRSNSDATAWFYNEHTSIGISKDDIEANGWQWIVGEP